MIKVLICDDSKKDAGHIKNIIKHFDSSIKISIVNTIDELDALLLDEKFSAIFLDLSFTKSESDKPIFEGLQAVPEILKLQQNIPIIFVSGYLDFDILRKIIQIKTNTIIDAISKTEDHSEVYIEALKKAIEIKNKDQARGKKLFDSALTLYQNQKYSDAFTTLTNAIDHGFDGENISNLFSNIISKISEEERITYSFFYKKINEMNEILKRTPSKEIKRALAFSYERVGDLANAVKLFEEIRNEYPVDSHLRVSIDKKLKILYNELGEIQLEKQLRDEILKIYQKKENIVDSIELLKKEILSSPSDPNLLLKLIILEKKQEQWEDFEKYTKLFLERLLGKIFDPEFSINVFKRLISQIDLTHKKLKKIYDDYEFTKGLIKFCIESEQIMLAYSLTLIHFDKLLKNDFSLLADVVEFLEIENLLQEAENLINMSMNLNDNRFYLERIKIFYRLENFKGIIKKYNELVIQLDIEFSNPNIDQEKLDQDYDKLLRIIPYVADSLINYEFYNNVSLAQEIIPFLLQKNRAKAFELIYKLLKQSLFENDSYNIQIFMDIYHKFYDSWKQADRAKLENAYYTKMQVNPEISTSEESHKISIKTWREKIVLSQHHRKKAVENFMRKCASSVYVDKIGIRRYINATTRKFHRVSISDDANRHIELEYYFHDGQYTHEVVLQTTTVDEAFAKNIRKEIMKKTKISDEELANEN